jgi:hypothetical protein
VRFANMQFAAPAGKEESVLIPTIAVAPVQTRAAGCPSLDTQYPGVAIVCELILMHAYYLVADC